MRLIDADEIIAKINVALNKGVDNCKNCDITENPRFYDIESDDYFTCSDCPCYGCMYLHNCDAQCAQDEGW